jgi:hypothetical protein
MLHLSKTLKKTNISTLPERLLQFTGYSCDGGNSSFNVTVSRITPISVE